MAETMDAVKDPRDKWIPRYFVMFFAFIALVDGTFCYIAITTMPGVVTDQAYEKGLAYNKTLAKAKAQPSLNQRAIYEAGALSWSLATADNAPLTRAEVSAKIIRPVQYGYDLDIMLEHKGGGIYEADLDLPLQGAWIAELSAEWDSKQYQTTLEFMAK